MLKHEIKISISYLQIYNENIDDLLSNKSSKLTIIDDPLYGTII